MRISDWSSDVCSSDLADGGAAAVEKARRVVDRRREIGDVVLVGQHLPVHRHLLTAVVGPLAHRDGDAAAAGGGDGGDHRGLAEGAGKAAHLQVELLRRDRGGGVRSEEHTSELQSLMRISYAVFCLKKKKK